MFKKFLRNYFLYGLGVFVIIAIISISVFDHRIQLAVFSNFLFFFFLIGIKTAILLKTVIKNNSNFLSLTLMSIFLKMLVAVAYFAFIYKQYNDQLLIFVGSFFISYLLFTIFEVLFLVRQLNSNKEKE